MTALLALALALALAPQPAASPPVHARVTTGPFERLSALVGTWAIADRPDSPLRIRFSLTAGGTVLAESWERAGKPHSLTLYHRDGATVIATHYCPQGNQPRLALIADGPQLRFLFRDATDLDAGESHLHTLAFDLTDRQKPVRSERYRRGKADAEESVLTLARVK